MLCETSYSVLKRLFFIKDVITSYAKTSGVTKTIIADIGCGTGELLTIPLSQEIGGDGLIYACEPETKSVTYLKKRIQQLNIGNILVFDGPDKIQENTLDILILSEVIEHVDDPGNFLRNLFVKIKPTGLIVITLPNGYGFFEIETAIYNSLEFVGINSLLRKVKRLFRKSKKSTISESLAPNDQNDGAQMVDTIAISPHVNFYSLSDILEIINNGGFNVEKIEGKQLLVGPFSDRYLNRSQYLLKINNLLGSKLPLQIVAGWMIVARKKEFYTSDFIKPEKKAMILKSLYIRYKRFINLNIAQRHSK